MKKILSILLVSLSLNTGASGGEAIADVSTSALSLDIEPYSSPKNSSPSTGGFLQDTKISIGTIIKSHHFNKNDYRFYNESHNGAYININQWSTGTFTNTAYKQSIFITYNPNLYRTKLLTVDLVAGVANGYEGLKYAQGDYVPILGASLQWAYLKAILSYDVVVFGVELSLN